MDSHDPTTPSSHPGRILAVLLLAGVSFALSQTLVIPALAQIGAEMDAGPSTTSWILTAFLLAASVSTTIVGKLGDLYGKGRVLTLVLALFALGGVINALADSIAVLIARSEEHTSELQSRQYLVCRLLLEKTK